ncbi:MAG TPA: twin-arginine translocase TatA/TatE family subunit [Thermoanaerobaculia bacterium]
MFEGLFQPMHLLLILGIALLFFGPKRLPELGKGLGTSIRDFRDAMSGQKPDDKANSQLEAPKAAVSSVGAVGTPLQTPVAQAAPAPAVPAPQAQAAPPQGPEGGTRA